MSNSPQNEYYPDSVSAPGETLSETLDALGMAQSELARRMGRPVKTINEIIQGKAAITAETALQLEQVLRIPASFWLKLEQQYREFLARLAKESIILDWNAFSHSVQKVRRCSLARRARNSRYCCSNFSQNDAGMRKTCSSCKAVSAVIAALPGLFR